MQAKHQRLVLILSAVAIVLVAVFLAGYALREQASYFYTPSELADAGVSPDQAIRLGGMVQQGSIRTASDGITVNFIVGDGKATIPVTYTGITPDLFVEGSGVVAEGRLAADGLTFVADNLLAKHDENYMPRELEGLDKEAIAASTARAGSARE
ncbi:MAG: cytochrome c maturation protein CcmE [Pseudomonadota bacterium]